MRQRVRMVIIAIGMLAVAMLCGELATGGLLSSKVVTDGSATDASATQGHASSSGTTGDDTPARVATLRADDDAFSRRDAELGRSELSPSPDDAPVGAETQPPSRLSEARATVALRNTCSVAVEMSWVDYEGQERSYGTIAPAQALDLATYDGHSWHLRTADGALLRGGVASDGQRWVTCDDRHRPAARAVATPSYDPDWPPDASPRSLEPAEIAVANNCGRDVELRWVDYDGRERVYATLAAGGRWTQASYHGHLWRVRDADGAAIHDFRAFFGSSITACRDARRDG